MKKLLFIFSFLLVLVTIRGQDLTFGGNGTISFTGYIRGDSAYEYTPGAGFTIEGVELKDYDITIPTANYVYFNAGHTTYIYDGSGELYFYDPVAGLQSLSDLIGGGSGTVTSITAGNGMDFSEITTSGSITLGTPTTLTLSTTNSVSGTTHEHALSIANFTSSTAGFAPASGGGTSNFLRADGTWTVPTQLTGSGASNQAVFWSSTYALTGYSTFTYNSGTGAFHVGPSSTDYFEVKSNGVEFIQDGSIFLTYESYDNSAINAALFDVDRYGGTQGTPAATPTDGQVERRRYGIYDGTSTVSAGESGFMADGAIATGDFDTKYYWQLKEGASASATKMELDVDGLHLTDNLFLATGNFLNLNVGHTTYMYDNSGQMYFYDATAGLQSLSDLLGTSLTLGTANQIPFMNGTTDFQYSSNFTFSTNTLNLNNTIQTPDGSSSDGVDLQLYAGDADGTGNDGGHGILKAGDAVSADATSVAGYIYLVPGTPYNTSTFGNIRLGDASFPSDGINVVAAGSQADVDLQFLQQGAGNISLGNSSTTVTTIYAGSNGVRLVSDNVWMGGTSGSQFSNTGGTGNGPNFTITSATGYVGGDYNGANMFIYPGAGHGTGVRGSMYFGDGSTLNALAVDETETYVIGIDPTTGLLSRRTVSGVGSVSSTGTISQYDIPFWNDAGTELTAAHTYGDFTITHTTTDLNINLRSSVIGNSVGFNFSSDGGTHDHWVGVQPDADDEMQVFADGDLLLNATTINITGGISADETESYLVGIDNTTGLLSKRTASGLGGGVGGDTIPAFVVAKMSMDTIPLFSFSGVDVSTGDFLGSFYNDGTDTIFIMQAIGIVQGSSTPTVPADVQWHNTFNSGSATHLNTTPLSVTSTTTGTEDTSFDNYWIPPDRWVWLEAGTVSGTVDYFSLTLLGYTRNMTW